MSKLDLKELIDEVNLAIPIFCSLTYLNKRITLAALLAVIFDYLMIQRTRKRLFCLRKVEIINSTNT